MEHKKNIITYLFTQLKWSATVIILLIVTVSCKGETGRRTPNPQYLLMKAAEKGDLALAQKAVTEGADLHAPLGYREDETWTALLLVMYNCHNGQRYVDVARFLLEQGADANVRSGSGTTPIMKAYGNIAMLRLLLEYGADIQASDHGGMTAVGYAAEYGQDAAVMLLIRHGADIHFTTRSGRTLLMIASQSCDPPVIQYLIDHGLNVNAAAEGRFTVLMAAVEHNNWNVIRLLLEHGADPNAMMNNNYVSPLLIAAGRGDPESAQILLEYGADVQGQTGEDVLNAVVYDGHCMPEFIELLGQYGVDIRGVDCPYDE